MAKTLVSTLTIGFGASHTDLAKGGVAGRNVVDKVKVNKTIELANGTGANQNDLVYQVQGTLAGSATVDLDLSGVLTDAEGTTIAFARIKEIIIENLSADPNTAAHLDAGGGSNPFIGPMSGTTPKDETRVGGITVKACADATGWAVTAATGDIFRLTNKHASQVCTYRITFVGASA